MQFEVNVELFNSIHQQLKELTHIVLDKTMDQQLVMNRLKKLSNDLVELNTTSQEIVDRYNRNWNEQRRQIKEQKETFKQFHKDFDKYLEWVEQVNRAAEKGVELTDDYYNKSDALQPDQGKLKAAIDQIGDTRMVNEVLQDYMHIHFAKKRQLSVYWTDFAFRFRKWISGAIKLILSAMVGTVVEFLVHYFELFDSELLAFIAATIIGYFIFDKPVDAWYGKYLWKMYTKQTFKLHKHLSIYTKQMKILIGGEQD